MTKLTQWINQGYCALFALLPWSLECSFGSWKMTMPSEPLIVVLGLGLAWFSFKNLNTVRTTFSRIFLLKISAAWVGWLAISACFSTMPIVSWKYWVVEAGHWWVFAVGLAMFPEWWPRLLRIFTFSMAGVAVYTLAHHSFYHFRADQSLLAPMPFFPEHTLYATVLAMVLLTPKGGNTHLVNLLFLVGLYFSFCRAAWLSVLLAIGLGLILIYREKWRLFVFIGGMLLIVMVGNQGQIMDRLKNKIASDVSILERLNRYACALRMVREQPWTGTGPGTFQFQYIPYQRPEEMTRISATEPVRECTPDTYGRGGGAHSEYLQALAETGWPGFLWWVLQASLVMYRGIRLFFQTKANQWSGIATVLALLTFFLHGLVNNTLHDGRVAALFWGMIMAISTMSLPERSSQ